MSTDPADFTWLPRVPIARTIAPATVIGLLLLTASFLSDGITGYHYLLTVHATHAYMQQAAKEHMAYLTTLEPVLELSVILAIVGAFMQRGNGTRLLGCLAVLLASSALVCSTLLAHNWLLN
jgi:hypothetical protein